MPKLLRFFKQIRLRMIALVGLPMLLWVGFGLLPGALQAQAIAASPSFVLAAQTANSYRTTKNPPVMPEVNPPSVNNTTPDELKFNNPGVDPRSIEQQFEGSPYQDKAEVDELIEDMQSKASNNAEVDDYLQQRFEYDTEKQTLSQPSRNSQFSKN